MNFSTPSTADFYRVMPELIWCIFGVLLMLLQSFTKNRAFLSTIAFLGARRRGRDHHDNERTL